MSAAEQIELIKIQKQLEDIKRILKIGFYRLVQAELQHLNYTIKKEGADFHVISMLPESWEKGEGL